MSKETVFAFLAGGVISGVGTWLGVRSYYRAIEEKRCSELEEYFDEKVKEMEQHCADCQKNVETVEDDEIVSESPEAEEGYISEEEVKKLIAKLNNGELKGEEVVGIPYDKFNERAIEKAKNKKPRYRDEEDEDEVNPDEVTDIYTITPQAYHDEFLESDKVVLTYCEGDEVFLDEDFNEVSRDATFAGIGGEETLGQMGEYESGVLYVRNETEETDYCIISDVRDSKTYLDETGGL